MSFCKWGLERDYMSQEKLMMYVKEMKIENTIGDWTCCVMDMTIKEK